MRNLTTLDCFRVKLKNTELMGDEGCGAFIVPSNVNEEALRVIASDGAGWDHISVSLEHRCPIWMEMEFIKRLFFKDNETAMQLHVPPDDHISYHPYCLHLWRPHHRPIPRPPAIMIAPKG
jgi:hypothetical protein